MEGKNAQELDEKSKVFQIPIEIFEKDMDTDSSRDKKTEILELFTTCNKLRSREEFFEVENYLHESCKEGDLDEIKILLMDTIEDSTRTLKYKIDETKRTASLLKVEKRIEEIFIPRTITNKSTKYVITSIIGTSKYLKKINFSDDSEIETFYKNAFCYSKIEEIYFPASLKELKEGWCRQTVNLNKIIISPMNGQFEFKDDKYLICKNESNKDLIDKLLFARRDIEELSLPPNIKVISSFAFDHCTKILKVDIPTNSNLQIIGSYAFSYTNIESIFIPSNVTKICENAFQNNQNLTKVEFPTNSNLQIIGSYAFSYTDLESIFIPSNVTKICDFAFLYCTALQKVEIPTNSNLQIIGINAFSYSNIKSIFIPSKVTKICEYAFASCKNLQNVEIPANSNLQTIERFTFSHSNIKSIFIPSKVTKICEYGISHCENLQKVEIPANNL